MALRRESFVSARITSPSGHARTFEETEAWLAPLIRRVPITRIVNVTPIDFLALPTWAAITPLAQDLTTHAGKGLTARAARLSAIMEAIERVSGERIPAGEEVRRSSFLELKKTAREAVLDPESFDLPFRSTYGPDRTFSWVRAWDLIAEEELWVPVDFVISPGTEGVHPGPHTNGLAAGNNYTEAALHALCEVIERDATAHDEFCDEFGEATDHHTTSPRMLDPETLFPEARDWHARVTEAGMRLVFGELLSDPGVPTFVVGLIDPEFPSPDGPVRMHFPGWGTDLDTRRALLRAVTEAVQARVLVMQGARDTVEGGGIIERAWTLRRTTDFTHPRTLHAFDGGRSASTGDQREDLREACRRVARAGFERVIVADVTRPDLGVPVVRVIVPGMGGPLRYGLRPSWRLMGRLV